MAATCLIHWVNNVTNKTHEIGLSGLSFDKEEIEFALEQGAVCILDSSNSLLMTCIAVAKVERVQSAGDLVIWPSGLAYRVINSAGE